MLTHDREFTCIGTETQIPYQGDFEFYLARLFRHDHWALSVMEFVNRGVFDTSYAGSDPTPPSESTPPEDVWEAAMLDEMDNYKDAPPSPAGPAPPMSVPVPTVRTSATVTHTGHGLPGSPSGNLDNLMTQCQLSLSLNVPSRSNASGEPVGIPLPAAARRTRACRVKPA